MVVGVMGGSFNPPHLGHTAVAQAVIDAGLADTVLMVLSPQNPLKTVDAGSADFVADGQRLQMLRLAVREIDGVEASDIELTMPRPSYTADTLERLAHENPGCRFRLIIGADNWAIFDRWRRSQYIVQNFSPIVYPRPGVGIDAAAVRARGAELLTGVPEFTVSSTEIRQLVHDGAEVNHLVAPAVAQYIRQHNLYQS